MKTDTYKDWPSAELLRRKFWCKVYTQEIDARHGTDCALNAADAALKEYDKRFNPKLPETGAARIGAGNQMPPKPKIGDCFA